ncbi:MAG TPA: hypothetical protein EYN36_01200 [Pelagibacteraceae bacterium]|jgi:hypothetical protein|nr:hypothetical protein [Pelagibacteraceae bacterium]
MKKENINNYYTDEDLINFEKLKNFKEFKVNKLNNNQNKSHPVRYAVSDNRNFNKIMNIDNNESSSKKVNKTKDYTPSDFENFKKLKQFTTFNDNEPLNNKTEPEKTITEYTNKDKSSFDKIIKSKSDAKNESENKHNVKIDNKKIKIIDFNKLNEREKNFKNKVGIEKIKVVYFD